MATGMFDRLALDATVIRVLDDSPKIQPGGNTEVVLRMAALDPNQIGSRDVGLS